MQVVQSVELLQGIVNCATVVMVWYYMCIIVQRIFLRSYNFGFLKGKKIDKGESKPSLIN